MYTLFNRQDAQGRLYIREVLHANSMRKPVQANDWLDAKVQSDYIKILDTPENTILLIWKATYALNLSQLIFPLIFGHFFFGVTPILMGI